MTELTPMMRQYRKIKSQYKDAVLFFRLGDFYEMFEKDAKEVSRILNLTLTSRHGVPMCGIPYHAAGNYIPRLLKAGKKIAVCEQTSLPEGGKGIAKREVVEVITPGTVINEDYLNRYTNNYLAAIGRRGEMISFAYVDLSTSEFYATSFSSEELDVKLREEMLRLNPSEIIIQESLLENDTVASVINAKSGTFVNRYQDWHFDPDSAYETLLKQFGVSSLKAFGLKKESPEIISCGVLINYIEDSSKSILPHIRSLKVFRDDDFLGLDEATQRNLEITGNLFDSGTGFTLLETLDKTKTAMGARKLKRWLLHPLKDTEEIRYRLGIVESFYHNQILLSKIRDSLSGILDIERLTSRVAMDRAHAKDLVSLSSSLFEIANVNRLISDDGSILFQTLTEKEKESLERIVSIVRTGIKDDPSILLTEGNLIKDGFNKELDELKDIKKNSQKILKDYLKKEQEESGISSMKIKYNRIIGHFIEVTKSNLSQVPDHFTRRQSLTNCERFTTDRLVELESTINSAVEKIVALERELFLEIRESVKKEIPCLLRFGAFISDIDCLQSFSHAATVNGYVKPEINPGNDVNIINGRHPVVEANMPPGDFIPNSVELSLEGKYFAMITGPNMAGKSTFLRQVALIVLMAQAGSFVPAEKAEIGITDKIFCRVGASDNLARGESTFLVEMNETAFILRHATEKSLIIMDEVGRGTSTNDGLSIAWAITEYLLDMGVKTLFATHYHELSQIKNAHLINLHLEIMEKGGEIIFLKRVKEGSSEKSYGIHVAKLAGIPHSVLSRAEEILESLDGKGISVHDSIPVNDNEKQKHQTVQKNLFYPEEFILAEIKSLDINKITPLEALNILARFKENAEA